MGGRPEAELLSGLSGFDTAAVVGATAPKGPGCSRHVVHVGGQSYAETAVDLFNMIANIDSLRGRQLISLTSTARTRPDERETTSLPGQWLLSDIPDHAGKLTECRWALRLSVDAGGHKAKAFG
jgi:hypothetical protein